MKNRQRYYQPNVGKAITNLIYVTSFFPSSYFIGKRIAAGFYMNILDIKVYRMVQKNLVCQFISSKNVSCLDYALSALLCAKDVGGVGNMFLPCCAPRM